MKGEDSKTEQMDEGRKRVLLIAASIMAARRLAQWDGKTSPASEVAISDAISTADRIMAKIDSRWPTSNQAKHAPEKHAA